MAPTNVVRIHNAFADTPAQLRYYHSGVGTGLGLLDHVEGGLVGKGLADNVKSAYAWLARVYEPGDAIYLFGFSRGAFTVRSLGGMIGKCGLPEALKTAEPAQFWRDVESLFTDGYRQGADVPADPVPIEFLGVWDTVGTLGIPDWLGFFKLVANHTEPLPRFHSTELGTHVRHARQALALDEMRGPFAPTLWSNLGELGPDRTAEQLWFPGDHCDVGGGHDRTGLSDGALAWMIGEVHRTTQLEFDLDMVSQVRPDPRDMLHDSLKSMYTVLCPAPRAIPFVTPGAARLHESATGRQQRPPISAAPYRAGRRLAAGDSATVDVYARTPWNWTGLYLERGDYELSAAGTWLDGDAVHDADGTRTSGRALVQDLLHAVATSSAWLQDRLAKLGHDDTVRAFGGRRCASAPWMALLGAVASEDLDHQSVQRSYNPFLIGSRLGNWHNDEPGYFYAFANDSWLGYPGNRGSLSLTIRKIR